MTPRPTRARIPVYSPDIGPAEIANVRGALERGEISGFFGGYLGRFEREFAAFCDCPCGVATSSGTSALHLALAALGVGPGDEVLVSTLTNMATFFAVRYQGARPVPIDIAERGWNLDPSLLEAHVTPRTRAILVVHLFGHPVDMDPVLDVARRHNLFVVEDCAEAHGALYKGRKVGSLGDAGCFSFYANKILTTGEGGMVTCRDAALAERARSLKSLAFGSPRKFMHTAVGFNYRMTNLQAAIGCAQLERVEGIIRRKREIADRYGRLLAGVPGLERPAEASYARHVYWMYHVGLTGGAAARRDEVMRRLDEKGIETREGFIPANLQEIFQSEGWAEPDMCPRANAAAYSTFYLPSHPTLSDEDVEHVAAALAGAVASL
jgi:perosamine synthetase